jgi:hypothetical protein
MRPNLLRLSCAGMTCPENALSRLGIILNDQHVEGSGSRIVASSHFLTAGTASGNCAGCGFGSSSRRVALRCEGS